MLKSFHSHFIIWTNFFSIIKIFKRFYFIFNTINRLILSSLYSLQIKIKWNSSSIDCELHIWQILSSSVVPLNLPVSICSGRISDIRYCIQCLRLTRGVYQSILETVYAGLTWIVYITEYHSLTPAQGKVYHYRTLATHHITIVGVLCTIVWAFLICWSTIIGLFKKVYHQGCESILRFVRMFYAILNYTVKLLVHHPLTEVP